MRLDVNVRHCDSVAEKGRKNRNSIIKEMNKQYGKIENCDERLSFGTFWDVHSDDLFISGIEYL